MFPAMPLGHCRPRIYSLQLSLLPPCVPLVLTSLEGTGVPGRWEVSPGTPCCAVQQFPMQAKPLDVLALV